MNTPPDYVFFTDRYLFNALNRISILAIAVHLVLSIGCAPSVIPVIADMVLLLLIGGFYWYGKDEPRKIPGVLAILVFSQIASLFMWVGMSGVQGPGIGVNIMAVTVYLLLDRKQRYVLIVSLVTLFTLAGIGIGYWFPEWMQPYASLEQQYLYIAGTFLCAMLITVSVMHYVLERSQAEQIQRQQLESDQEAEAYEQQFISALQQLQEYTFLKAHTSEHFQELLRLFLKYTDSQYGFLIYAKKEEDQLSIEPLAHTYRETCLDPKALLEATHWATGQVVDFSQLLAEFDQSYHLQATAPRAYAEIKELLYFPIYYDAILLGVVAIGRPQPYGEIDAKALEPFLSTYGTILYNLQLKQAQQHYWNTLARAKEQAEQATQAQEDFFTNISHELRSPLSLVVGPVSALLSPTNTNELHPDTRRSLEMVLRNSKKMLQYVNDIMDLAKLNSKTLTLQVRTNHLYSFVQSIYQAFEIQKDYRDVQFELDFRANRDLVLEFDSPKIEKILNNLLSNAFKYTLDQGLVKWIVEERKNSIYFSVEDTGAGIDPEDLPHIFDRFYQTNKAQEIAVAGTGVGLSLAQELAQLHGCQLEAESQLGKGARFFFELPIVRAEFHQEAPTLAEDHPDHKPDVPHILLVEDNHDMADFIQLVLKSQYNIDVAQNGAEGWKQLQANPDRYQLLITDLMMPEMDGFELLRLTKGTKWGAALPTIVLTARADAASKLEALTIGIDEYLTKPFSVEELMLHVKNLMDNASVRQTAAQESEVEEEDKTQIIEPSADENKPTRLTPVQREKIDRARKIVLENIDEPDFGVEVLARALATSKRQLYRFMQLHTGLTPLKFINEIRLQEARRMLEQGLCSTVKEVSYSIGFLSTRHFSKTYANRFGKKPSEYFR